MYALYIIAIPDGTLKEYDLNKSYPIICIVNTFSKKYAIEKAKKVLQINNWVEINIYYIGVVPEKKKGEYKFSEEDPTKDYEIFVFPHQAKRKWLQKLIHNIHRVLHRANKTIHNVWKKST